MCFIKPVKHLSKCDNALIEIVVTNWFIQNILNAIELLNIDSRLRNTVQAD